MEVSNRLIDGLPRKPRDRILQLCEPADLPLGAILCERDRTLRQVFFPLTGIISLVAVVDGHPPLEMGLIGNEGMLGASLVLGINAARLRGVVQCSGTALAIPAEQFRHELRGNPLLERRLNRYVYVLMAQLSQVAVCTCFHELKARLARWLLMTHDRAHADHFRLTHEVLAGMLGVRRSAVTIAAGALQRLGLIGYARGDIQILDRGGLMAMSCACYRAVVDDYQRHLG